jgi:hypothetical protein
VKVDRREGRELRQRSTWVAPVSERKNETAVVDRAAPSAGAGGTGGGGGGILGVDTNQGTAATWPWTERGFVKKLVLADAVDDPVEAHVD